MAKEDNPTKDAHWDKSGRLKAYGKTLWDTPTLAFKVDVNDPESELLKIKEFGGYNFLGFDRTLLFRYSMFRVPDGKLKDNEFRLHMAPFAPMEHDKWIIARNQLPRSGRPLYNKPDIKKAETVFFINDIRYLQVFEGAIDMVLGQDAKFAVTAMPISLDYQPLREYSTVDLGPLKGKNVVYMDTNEPFGAYDEKCFSEDGIDYYAHAEAGSYDGLLIRTLMNMKCKVRACYAKRQLERIIGEKAELNRGFVNWQWTDDRQDKAVSLLKMITRATFSTNVYQKVGDDYVLYVPGMPAKKAASPFDGEPPAEEAEESTLRDNQFFRLLGPTTESKYAILDKRTNLLKMATYGNLNEQTFLNDLAPKHFWAYYCEAASDMDAMKAPNRSVLQEMLSGELKTMPLFNDRNIKGRGWHWISMSVGGKRSNVPVCHAGDRLIIDNKTVPLDDQVGENNVWLRQEGIDWGEPVLAADAQTAIRAFKLVRHFKWLHPYHARLMSGWIALAPICGLLKFRPAIWLQGDSGAGKTYFIGKVLRPLLGSTLESLVAMSTEAAIRRILHFGSTSFVIDEQEAETPKERERMDEILKIMRISSAEDSGDVIKSSMNSNSDIIRTRLRAMMLFSSVGGRIMLSTNTNRIMTIELKLCPEEDRKDYYLKMSEMLENLGDDDTVGMRFRHFILKNVDNLIEGVNIGKRVAARNVHHIQRDADLIGSLVGASFVLEKGGGLPSEDDVQKAMEDLVGEFATRERSKDWENLLEEIRNIRIDVSHWATMGGGVDIRTAKVSQLVAVAAGEQVELMRHLKQSDAADMLLHHGVRVYSRSGDPKRMPGIGRVWIARSHKEIERGLAQTPFAKIDYGRILARMPNTESPARPVYIGGFSKRVVDMPLAKLWQGYSDSPTEDDSDYAREQKEDPDEDMSWMFE